MRPREKGQTIIIAMIVLGVLLILGFVFVGLLRGNVRSAQRNQSRTLANDLAEAGIRYAHSQLLHSSLGADWRGTPTAPIVSNPGFTRDPDAYYLRPASRNTSGQAIPFRPGAAMLDQGGPDGLGPYVRVAFNNGRALIRVRYAPSDANIFSANPTGPLRKPGAVRNYLIIESVGREGVVKANDPTTTLNQGTELALNFNSTNELQAGLADYERFTKQWPNSRALVAYNSIGIIESARYITNVFNVSRPADLGIPAELGSEYVSGVNTIDVAANLPLQLGTMSNISSSATTVPPGQGSVFSNADLLIHGKVETALNTWLGDSWIVAGSISLAPSASLSVTKTDFNVSTGTWNPPGPKTTIDVRSNSSNYTTYFGLVRDGVQGTDVSGYTRSAGRKEPPSILSVDSQTNESRYIGLTRESGYAFAGSNTGKYGYGSGVYVGNVSDRQEPEDETSRREVGTERSLFYDWLNPNNDGSTSWKGGFYQPPAAYVQLLNDGFTIQLNSSASDATERIWKRIDGGATGSNFIRYRLGRGTDNRVHIVSSYTPVNAGSPAGPYVNVNGNLTPSDFQLGPVFNNVIYLEGNARVRGVIPTDVQLSIVSNATIYIEGNILKGVVGNDVTGSAGQRLQRPTRSMLLLAAKDNVAVNTTQFFGPSSGQTLESVSDTQNNSGYNAVRVAAAGGSMSLVHEQALDPTTGTDPTNPSQWLPYTTTYYEAGGNPSDRMTSSLLLAHTSDDGAAPASFISMKVNRGLATPNYYFPTLTNTAALYASLDTTTVTTYPVYGLGSETWQRYNKFEVRSFPIVTATDSFDATNLSVTASNTGTYTTLVQGTNEFDISAASIGGAASNDYLLARAAVVPADVRIEATVFAEQGSFFVIPGPWFNPNPNDRRDVFDSRINALINSGMTADNARARAEDERKENFGAFPEAPFFGEPLDVRVVISGAVSENMPPPISVQAEWIKKWGWIPKAFGATRNSSGNQMSIPQQHISGDNNYFVPNLIIQYDPVLATSRIGGLNGNFSATNDTSTLIRVDDYGRALPPLPRLPVSPTLAYFGEVQ